MATDNELLESMLQEMQAQTAILNRMASANAQAQSALSESAKDSVTPIETPGKPPSSAVSGSRRAAQSRSAQSSGGGGLFKAGQILLGSATESTAETLLSLRKFKNEGMARGVGSGIDSKLGTNIVEKGLLLGAQYRNQYLTRRQNVISSAISQTQGQLSDPSLLGVSIGKDQIAALYKRNKDIEKLKDEVGERVRAAADKEENAQAYAVARELSNYSPENTTELLRDILKQLFDVQKAIEDN